MGIPALSPHFQLHLTREGRMDQLAVHVECRPGTADPDAAEAGATLSARVKNTIGVTRHHQRRGAGDDRALHGQDAPHRGPPAALAGKMLL